MANDKWQALAELAKKSELLDAGLADLLEGNYGEKEQ